MMGSADTRPRVLVCDPAADKWKKLLDPYFKVTVQSRLSEEELVALVPDCHAIIVDCETRISSSVIDQAKRLKVIGRTGPKLSNIDVRAAKAKKVTVLSSPDAVTTAVAEHTMALLLSLVRGLPQVNQALRQNQWNPKAFIGASLSGKTLGIVGFGRIGQEVTRRAQAFGMQVIVNQRRKTPRINRRMGVEAVGLEALLSSADIVSLHVSKKIDNVKMIGPRQLALMKKTAFLINTSTETVINEKALLHALDHGRLAGAGLDVYETGTPWETDLIRHPRVIATPNIGASTEDARQLAAQTIANQIIDILEKARIENPLSLRVVAAANVHPHENIDPRRVARLVDKIKDATLFTNPPIVVESDNKYIVLDGATRTTAFKQLNYPHLIVQVFSENDQLILDTWHHAIRRIDPNRLIRLIGDLPEVELIPSESETILQELADHGGLCSLITVDNQVYHIKAAEGVNHLDALNKLTDRYIRASYVTRSVESDIDLLLNEYPDLAALVSFPKYSIDQVLQIARAGRTLPAGITRFVIPGRVMRLNASLSVLQSSLSLSEKNEWLNRLTMEKLANDQVRYYEEPVYLLDE